MFVGWEASGFALILIGYYIKKARLALPQEGVRNESDRRWEC